MSLDTTTAIVVAVALLILFSSQLGTGAKWLWQKMPQLRAPTGLLTAKVEIQVWKLVALLALFWFAAGGLSWQGCTLPTWPGWPSLVTKADSVTYVHEQRSGSITPAIRAALNTLNEKGIIATEFDVDIVNKGGGAVPKQYVVPLAAAKQVGLPAAVSTAGDRVLKTIKDAKAEDILALAP